MFIPKRRAGLRISSLRALGLLAWGVLAVGLSATGFAGAAQAEPAAPAIQVQIQSIPQDISSVTRAAPNVTEQLKARGATMVPRSQLPARISPVRGSKFTCDKSACWCTNVKSCMKLTDKVCKSFVCNNDHGEPACWCEL